MLSSGVALTPQSLPGCLVSSRALRLRHVPCQYGIQDACALVGCDYQWTGSETSDVAQMVNAMNAAIAGKADAIAVCLVDPRGFDRPVENALAAGIPVFSYNADSHTNIDLS